MTTQQEPQTEQPQDITLRVGKLEGLMEMVIEQQRTHTAAINALNARMDRRTLAVLGGALLISGSIIGGLIAIIITVL